MIKFTIAIPAYKKKFLSEAIESCLDQTYRDFELVVVNDHSPEDLDSVISHYDDPRIRYYVNDKNFGAVNVVDNWNRCLEYATGDYFICMGDDDRLLPCCLSEYAKLIDKYPNLSVYHAWTQLINEEGCVYMYQEQRPEYEGAYSFLYHRWNFRFWQYIGDFCLKTERLRQWGGYYKLPLAWTSDDITVFRAALDAGIANTQTPCFQYRCNGQNISSNGNIQQKMQALKLAKEWYLEELNEYRDTRTELIDKSERHFFSLLSQALISYFRKRFFWTLNEELSSRRLNLRFWTKIAPEFSVSPHDVKKEVYNYYMKRLFHIGNSY